MIVDSAQTLCAENGNKERKILCWKKFLSCLKTRQMSKQS